jgi:polyisoprenyl-phosphate glycosyltransferase
MLSIILPIFNEEEVIPALYTRVNAAAKRLGMPYEVITVDDGSSDRSKALLREISQKNSSWKVLSFSRNFGHQVAVSAGLYYSSGDVVAVLDADLQDPPEELGRFIAKWKEGYQVVYAIRTKRKEGLLKRAAYATFYRLLRLISSLEIPLDSGDFCVMDRVVVDVLRRLPERTRFVRGLRTWAGFRQIGLTYERQSRQGGEVKYTLPKLFKLALDGIVSFSTLPLRLASWIGIALCGASFLMVAFVLIWWTSGLRLFSMQPGDALGWTSLSSMVLFLSGAQMLFVGIIGEYLARVFDEVKARQPWVIADAAGFFSNADAGEVGWFARNRSADDLRPILPAVSAR